MFLDRFHTLQDGNVQVSALQASQFAKEIAGDFNPIHDPDARRFCVPGDLLFALVLDRFGLSRRMTFEFRSLVGADVPLNFTERSDGHLTVDNGADKVYLDVTREGDVVNDPTAIEAFVRCYVAASGKNFPHTLKPLMESEGVMFNPDRPMIMYESMSLALDDPDAGAGDAGAVLDAPELVMDSARLDANGKRGNVTLDYHLHNHGAPVGSVTKRLVVSGLRPYCAEAMAAVVEEFYRLKARGTRYGAPDANG